MSNIERNVMSSVAMVYLARKFLSMRALKLYVLGASVVGIVAFVSVGNVAQNFMQVAQNGPVNMAGFIIAAVAGTTLLVQFALFLGACAAGSLFFDFVRTGSFRNALRV